LVGSNAVVIDAVAITVAIVVQVIAAELLRRPWTLIIQVIDQAVAIVVEAIAADFSAGCRAVGRASAGVFAVVAQPVATVNRRTTVSRAGAAGFTVIAEVVSAIRIGPAVQRAGVGVFAVSRLANTVAAAADPTAGNAGRLPVDAIDFPIAVQAVALLGAFGNAVAADRVGIVAIGRTGAGVFAVVAQAVAAEWPLNVGTIVREDATIVADQVAGVEAIIQAGLAGEVISFALLPSLVEPAVAAAHLHQRIRAGQRSQAVRVFAVDQTVEVVVAAVVADFGHALSADVGTSHQKNHHKNKRKLFHNELLWGFTPEK